MATSPRPYQRDNKKYGNAADMFSRPRQSVKGNIEQRQSMTEKIKMWTTFYRRNIHRFAEHYLGFELFFFQKIMLYLMSISTSFVSVASRGTSKSYIIAVYACCEAILRPNSIVVICASTREQGGLIVKEKIEKELMVQSANLRREIRKLETSQNSISVQFHNGSRIIVTVAADSARGLRANFLIFEEWRLIPKEIIDEILRPFLISRQVNFLKKPEYRHLAEEPKQLHISSAYYKSYQDGYMWKEMIINAKNMIKGFEIGDFSYVITGFDYLLSIYHGLKTRKSMDDTRAKTDEISFLLEYANIMYDENESSYFKLNMFRQNQTIKKCFYPYRAELWAGKKKKYQCNIPRQAGEIRLVTADISTRAGKANDNSIFGCIRLLPTNKGYVRETVYLESHNGENTIKQALRIKQLYHDFEADYVVLDIQNSGIAIYEQLGNVTKDDERDTEYDPMTIMSSIRKYSDMTDSTYEELVGKTMSRNAKPVIYPISATAKINSEIAVDFRDKLQRNMILFLIESDKAEDYLLDKNEDYKRAFENLDSAEKAKIINPYIQTSELVNECVNLEYTVVGGNIKMDDKRARKDRYSSISYGNYFATKLEVDILHETSEDSWDNWESLFGF